MYQLRRPLHTFTPDVVAILRTLALNCQPTPGPGGSGMTPFVETRQIFWEHRGLLALFPTEWYYCSIVSLQPSSQIVAHRDSPIVGVRHHIPLQVNDGCWVFSQNVWQQLEVGRVYQMDPTEPHGAVNWGSEVRLHLMIDTEVPQ